MRKLPPLNSIKAFEATARHLSFSKAAIELNVTAGAISQQVKALENTLGVTLFKRQNRLILLTEEGQACLPHISMGLDKISEGVSALYQYENKRPLTITLTPTFASGWLIPRLSKFKKKHPEIDIRIDATNEVVDLINDDIDIAIRFGSGEFAGLEAEYLFPQNVFPVCSPKLIETVGSKPKRPESLKHYPLLHSAYSANAFIQADWDMWFATVGVDSVDTSQGVHFTQKELMIQATIEGQGVALLGDVIISKDLKEGRLIRLFESSIALEFSYFFVCTKAKLKQPRIKAFRDWLLYEVSLCDLNNNRNI